MWFFWARRCANSWGYRCSTHVGLFTLAVVLFFGCTVQLAGEEGDGTPLQYSCLENPMDGGAWWAAIHGVAKSRARLSDFPFTFHFHELGKKMASHSSILAWRSPGMGEPGGLPSMGLHRVGHDWNDLAAATAPAATDYSSSFNCFLKSKSLILI